MPDDAEAARAAEEKAIEMFKIKKLITSLQKAKGFVPSRMAAQRHGVARAHRGGLPVAPSSSLTASPPHAVAKSRRLSLCAATEPP